MTPEPVTPEEQELALIWPERFGAAAVAGDCGFPGCLKPVHSTGFCNGHYQQHWKGRGLSPLRPRAPRARVVLQVVPQPPQVLVVLPPPAPVAASPGWKKQCTATDADTGKRCSLLEHGAELQHNASGRPFRNPLAAGALPRRELDLYARAGSDR